MKIYYQLFKVFYEKAILKMLKEAEGFFFKDAKVLDIGCGNGLVAKLLKEKFKVKVLGVDIEDRRIEKIPFKLADGKKLPFPNDFFDISLISFVFHHSPEPYRILMEAKRVSSKIIIYEDLKEGKLGNLISKLHRFSWQLIFLKRKEKGEIRTENEWRKIFRKANLEIIYTKKYKDFFCWPVKKILFVLKRK